jgi:hypothetical protein
VPRLAGNPARNAAGDLDQLRASCRAAIALLFGAAPDVVVVVGSGPQTREYPPGAGGTLRPWGVDERVTLGARNGVLPSHDLPLSVAIGGWLLGVPPRDVRGQAVAADLPPAECADLGRKLTAGSERVALLVMGDGSACRTEKAPGYLDARAEPFDTAAANAFDRGDTESLLAIDPDVAAELQCAGRAPWQVLAGAAQATGVPRHRRLLRHEAPYGVGYLVASWS